MWLQSQSCKTRGPSGQESLTWIRLIMIFYFVPWWPSWLSDQIAFSDLESDDVWRVSRLLSWPPSWKLELNDFSNSEFPCLPTSFSSIWLTVWENMWFQKFQDGCHCSHLGYHLHHLHNITMPPIKFKLNPTYGLGADEIWRFSRWLLWWPSWISRQNHLSNSQSRYCPDAFHQVLAQSDLPLGSR